MVSSKGLRPFFIFTFVSGDAGLLIDGVLAEFGPILPLSLLEVRTPSGTAAPTRASPADPQTAIVERLEGYFGRALAAENVPGFAVAIVKDSKPVLVKGYGVRRRGDVAKVDPDTLFYTASVTKQFTATALALLAQDGKVALDAPVQTYLPYFATNDPYITHQSTLRDLLAHRIGLPRADLLAVSGRSERDVIERWASLPPAAPFRARVSYSNQGYLAAGEIGAALAGQPWPTVLRNRLFEPLGLSRTNADGIACCVNDANRAHPHGVINGEISAFEPFVRPPTGAGAVNTTATDLARWLTFLLNDGRLDARVLLQPGAARELFTANAVSRPQPFAPGAHVVTYGLGWFLHDYRGRFVAQHGGNAEGWSVVTAIMPEERLGVGVLTNLHDTVLPYALMFRVFDEFVGEPVKDWLVEVGPRRGGVTTRPALKLDAESLTQHAGSYERPAYGLVDVTLRDGTLTWTYGPRLAATLIPVAADRFAARWLHPAAEVQLAGVDVTFRRAGRSIAAMTLHLPDAPIEFTHVAR